MPAAPPMPALPPPLPALPPPPAVLEPPVPAWPAAVAVPAVATLPAALLPPVAWLPPVSVGPLPLAVVPLELTLPACPGEPPSPPTDGESAQAAAPSVATAASQATVVFLRLTSPRVVLMVNRALLGAGYSYAAAHKTAPFLDGSGERGPVGFITAAWQRTFKGRLRTLANTDYPLLVGGRRCSEALRPSQHAAHGAVDLFRSFRGTRRSERSFRAASIREQVH